MMFYSFVDDLSAPQPPQARRDAMRCARRSTCSMLLAATGSLCGRRSENESNFPTSRWGVCVCLRLCHSPQWITLFPSIWVKLLHTYHSLRMLPIDRWDKDTPIPLSPGCRCSQSSFTLMQVISMVGSMMRGAR